MSLLLALKMKRKKEKERGRKYKSPLDKIMKEEEHTSGAVRMTCVCHLIAHILRGLYYCAGNTNGSFTTNTVRVTRLKEEDEEIEDLRCRTSKCEMSRDRER